MRVSSGFQPVRVGYDSYHSLKVKGGERTVMGGRRLNCRNTEFKNFAETIVLCDFMKSRSPPK